MIITIKKGMTTMIMMMMITSPPCGKHTRVTSGKIWIGGQLIVRPSEFKKRVRHMTKTITLDPSNKLNVRLAGKPGAFITIKITGTGDIPTNSPPVLDPIAGITVNEGETVAFAPAATDPDADTLTFSYSGWMTSASYTTTFDDAGTHLVTVTVSDGTLTDSQDVTVSVNNVNRTPVLDPIADLTLNEGETVTFAPTAADQDNDTLTFSYTGWMTSESYTTTYDDAGVYTVTVTVSDGTLTDFQDVSVTVNNVNRAPVLDPIADLTLNEGETVAFAPAATDPDADTLTFSYSGWMTSTSPSFLVSEGHEYN